MSHLLRTKLKSRQQSISDPLGFPTLRGIPSFRWVKRDRTCTSRPANVKLQIGRVSFVSIQTSFTPADLTRLHYGK